MKAKVYPFQRHHDEWLKDIPGCCGACDQGRKSCVTPQACERAESETPLVWWARIKRAFYGFVADVESWR